MSKPKNLEEVTNFIRERRKQAAAAAAQDPNDKGAAPTPPDPDKMETEKTVPQGESGNTGKPKDMTDKDTSKSGEPTAATTNKTVVAEPETPTLKAAKAVEDILLKVKGGDKKASDKEDPKEEPKKEASDKEDPKEEPKKEASTDEDPKEEPKKEAASPKIVAMDADIVVKLASLIRDNEARTAEFQKWAEEDYGREQAENLIKWASASDEELQALYAQEEATQALIKEAAELYESLEDEEKQNVDKLAQMVSVLTKDMKPHELEAFDLGMKQAAEIADAGGALPMPEEAPSLEEIAAMLEQMVASGEITEEEAMQILEQVAAEEEAAAMPEDVKAANDRFSKLASLALEDE